MGFHEKPIAVLDPTGVYNSLNSALADLTRMNFMKPGQHELVPWCTEVAEAINHLESIDKS